MKLTEQQAEVISLTSTTKESYIVNSVAGSGKTTTGVEAVKACGSIPAVALSFAKRNAEDLMLKMPENVTCKTFNAFGLKAWMKRSRKGGRANTRKSYEIRDKLNITYDQWPDFARALSMVKNFGLVPPGAIIEMPGISPWEDQAIHEILDNYNLWPDVDLGTGVVYQAMVDAMKLSIEQAWQGNIDFDDMLYMPAIYQAHFDKFDLIVVDEVQDVSPIQRLLVYQIAGGQFRSPDTRILALGDAHQAIYGFRGADHHSMQLFEDEFNCKPLALTVSFRCPKAITREAQQYVPEMEPHPDAPEGRVLKILPNEDHPVFQPGDAILCRNNLPLIKMAFKLIKNQIPAKVIGRDIGKGLEKLVKNMKCQRTAALRSKINDYMRRETGKLFGEGKPGAANNLKDRCESLMALCESLGDVPVGDLTRLIDRMFSDGVSAVTLSTVHRSKGLEWQRVFFLDSHLIPSRFAETEEELQQEYNIAYVGITRAMRDLYYISSPGEE